MKLFVCALKQGSPTFCKEGQIYWNNIVWGDISAKSFFELLSSKANELFNYNENLIKIRVNKN